MDPLYVWTSYTSWIIFLTLFSLRFIFPTQSLVVDLQRAGHVVEFERKKAALDQFIQAIRDPVGRFSVRVRRDQIVGDGTSTEIVNIG